MFMFIFMFKMFKVKFYTLTKRSGYYRKNQESQIIIKKCKFSMPLTCSKKKFIVHRSSDQYVILMTCALSIQNRSLLRVYYQFGEILMSSTFQRLKELSKRE